MNPAAITPIYTQETMQPMASRELGKPKLARHASFNITPTSVAIQRQVSSAPSSPRREQMGKRHDDFQILLYYSPH